ncbi:MAG: class I SAM-dependent methyltransferase [Rhodospirillales bacterium]|nr:class I SAM-dependent methyltransferase [Rhodospirillales bacterium]MDH3910848.1 class I SAM-dependent methyltransferase [Rhodospirillales bacterium]MDH3969611.1 class I SAM-dependent methyltransferase [Rhodospirillales bacterium]
MNPDNLTDQGPMLRRRFSAEQLESYLAAGQKSIRGWLHLTDSHLIAGIGQFQTTSGFDGSLGEIGVLHGKSFILLYLLSHASESTFAIDVFEQQELNLDRSGHGTSKEKFLSNLRECIGDDRHVRVFDCSSVAVSPEDLLDAVGPVRFFSIDGGHTDELTANDLTLADRCLCEHGVILVDDYFNRNWPGVSNGVHRFFETRAPRLAPFAIGANKVFFCRPDFAEEYRAGLRRNIRPTYAEIFKRSVFFGFPVDIYRPPVDPPAAP